MKKKLVFIIFLIVLSILIIEDFISIPCFIHLLTKLYCPGCGATRMVKSILKLDFYQAFRYNQLLFIFTPFFLLLIVDHIISYLIKKDSIYKKIPEYIWIIIIILFLVFGVIRNIFPYFAPTTI